MRQKCADSEKRGMFWSVARGAKSQLGKIDSGLEIEIREVEAESIFSRSYMRSAILKARRIFHSAAPPIQSIFKSDSPPEQPVTLTSCFSANDFIERSIPF